MSDNHSRFYDAFIVHPDAASFLVKHFANGSGGVLNVVECVGVFRSQFVIHVLQVRQIDLNRVVKLSNRLHTVISVGVEHEYRIMPTYFEGTDDDLHLRHKMRWRHESDKSDTGGKNRFDLLDDADQVIMVARDRRAIFANLVVLAIDALHITVIEKEIADSALSGQRGLLAPMGEN